MGSAFFALDSMEISEEYSSAQGSFGGDVFFTKLAMMVGGIETESPRGDASAAHDTETDTWFRIHADSRVWFKLRAGQRVTRISKNEPMALNLRAVNSRPVSMSGRDPRVRTIVCHT